MDTAEGLPVILLFLGVTAVVWLLRRWVSPHLDEAIASRNSLNNGQPYEPPDPPPGGVRRFPRLGRLTLLSLPVLPFALFADPRVWLRDLRSDCAEADGSTVRLLIVASHICSAPSRISVVWSGRCRKFMRLMPR
jgi:hypothetical protein